MRRQPLRGSGQLLLVLAEDWTSTAGRLQRFVRAGDAAWQAVGENLPVSLGRGGLAWGSGLHAADEAMGRQKTEGDGCAPAGVFSIDELFGEGSPESVLGGRPGLPYRAITSALKAVDDPASRHYNRLVDLDDGTLVDWTRHEEMRRADGCYAVGAVLGHNVDPVRPGGGSCIFLHVWKGAGVPTEGCTAGEAAAMRAVCAWLRADALPRFVLLPRAEYRRLAEPWQLPDWPDAAAMR